MQLIIFFNSGAEQESTNGTLLGIKVALPEIQKELF
jgi:hypothetical protein